MDASRSLRPFRADAVTASVAQSPLAPDGSEVRLVEWIADPGGEDPPMLIAPVHVHWLDDETWYVLEGRLSVLLDDRVATVGAGGAVTAVRGTRHTFWNPDPVPCRYLISMPPRVADLIDALHSGGSESPDELFRRYGSELLGGWELPAGLRAAD